MKYKIYNVNIIDGGKIISDKALYISGGKILAIKADEGEEDFIPYDGEGLYASAGFIDMHLHGGGDYDFLDGGEEAFLVPARMHLEHGATSILPTMTSGKVDELIESFEFFRRAKQNNKNGAGLIGIHLEGPYFSPYQCGAQDPAFIRNPDENEYKKILDSTDDIIRWSAAPELEGALEFGDHITSRGILCSAGHTNATYEQLKEAFYHGYTHITHLYSCTSTVHRKNAFRFAGVVEGAYLIDGMTVEIIADGIHLPGSLLQFVVKFKGTHKTALVTDAMRGAGMPDGESILGSRKNGQKVILEDGVAKLPDRSAFAGSIATADRLVRTMIDKAGVSLCEAVRMASEVPAEILGISDKKGRLKEGADADVVLFDPDINIKAVFVGGEIRKGKK